MKSKLKSIVLVEDNLADVKLTEYALKSLEERPPLIHFFEGPDLLQYLADADLHEIAVVIIDLNMPKMSGIELLKIFRNDAKLHNMPVLVFSSSDDPNDMQNCYDHGASAYVVKPSGLEELETTMRQIVDFWCQANSLPPVFWNGRFSPQEANVPL
ncbi:MAG: response regulator [Saprospiraceae bacterium]|nr:response regulator [Saprospiraceae bacterium]